MNKKNNKAQKNNFYMTLWGCFMHIILLWGVLDANFHSPIIAGLPVISMPQNYPAKRVFIFVADGLRFRTFKNHVPPYLNSVIQDQGVWGISHTRMPTESRPGNIAIVAGLYEDPSALFKGWKENPVDFDSIFNQSRASWLWGSPDIITLFTKGHKSHIRGSSYPANWQDFDKRVNVTKRLDEWVFNQYWNWLLNEAPHFKTKDKIVVYFHLLGCDTIGHAAKPHSKEYIETMKNVDANIKKVVEVTENYFETESTAYIFTADHGMTDWGSHGSGSDDETETPLVAWGAGLKKHENFVNIEQVDITPLVATLTGISIPTNNEGVLPYGIFDKKYNEYIANAFLINAKQLVEQVRANRMLTIGKSIANIYWKDKELDKKLKIVDDELKTPEDFQKFFKEVKHIIALAKETLSYYRHYQTDRFLFCLAITWIGWITFLFVDLSGTPRSNTQLGCFSWMIMANVALIVVVIPLIIEYTVAGCKEWRLIGYGIISAVSTWIAFRKIIVKSPSLNLNSASPVIECISILVLIWTMFIGLMYRWCLSVSMLFTVFLQKLTFGKHASSQLMLSGIALAVFPLLPVVGPKMRGNEVLFALSISVYLIIKKKAIYKYVKMLEITRIILSSLLCLNLLDGKSWLSWFLLVSTPCFIWLYPKETKLRLFGVTVALLSPFALLSASHEPLFFLTFSYNLQHWPITEYNQQSIRSTKKKLSLRSFSLAAFLMLYMLLCFFGTGNMASISSFDPSWTQHFLTIFSPFTMATLVLLKIVIPLILVGCLIHALETSSTIFFAVLLLGDCLAIPLMYRVTNEGSWLEIGSAISRFIIAITLPCLLLVVYYINKLLMTLSWNELVRVIALKYQKFIKQQLV